jgi:hypothetical protein
VSKIIYRVVKRMGGWAYEANGTYSESFRTRDSARKAAKVAASEQATPGRTTQVTYEDQNGDWPTAVDRSTDCPKRIANG